MTSEPQGGTPPPSLLSALFGDGSLGDAVAPWVESDIAATEHLAGLTSITPRGRITAPVDLPLSSARSLFPADSGSDDSPFDPTDQPDILEAQASLQPSAS